MRKYLSLLGALLLISVYLLVLPLALIRLDTLFKSTILHQIPTSKLLEEGADQHWRYPLCLKYLHDDDSAESRCSWKNIDDSFKYHLRLLENKTIALIGDSRIRHMFTYLKSMLDHRNFHFRDSFNDTVYYDLKRNITVYFYARWFPNDDTNRLLFEWKKDKISIPAYLFFECGAWPLFRYGPEGLRTFKENLTAVAHKFIELRNHTTAIWMKTLPFHPNAESGHGTWIKMRNGSASLEEYSSIFETVGRAHNLNMWTSAYKDAKTNLDKYMDHVHPGAALIRKALCQLLLSMDYENCGKKQDTKLMQFN